MPILNLPEPTNWPKDGARLGRVTVVIGVFIGLGVFFGVRNVLRDDYLSALVILFLQVPFLLALIAIHRVAGGRTTLRATTDSTGLTLRADRTFSTLMLSAFAVMVPLGLIVVVFTLTGQLHMFTSTGGKMVSVALAAAVTVTAAVGLISVWRRGSVGYVKLAPAGMEVADMFRTTSVAWKDVVTVDDRAESKKTRKAVVIKQSGRTESVIDGADFYVPNGAGLYWAVRHYWRHPEDRVELEDGRALQRLSEGRLDVS
jgi:hypothetical protein